MNNEDPPNEWSLGDWYHWHTLQLKHFHGMHIRRNIADPKVSLERKGWEEWETEFKDWMNQQDFLSDGTTAEHGGYN